MPLTLDPRSQLAKNFREGMDLTDIMPGPMGMAARMSSPAVDVLSRWIRRFRKDKPPTVPEKHIKKALENESERRTEFGEFGLYDEGADAGINDRSSMIRDMILTGEPAPFPVRYLGVHEKDANAGLRNLLQPAGKTPINLVRMYENLNRLRRGR